VSEERIIEIEIPGEYQAEYVSELTDFIENELKPPSRVRWILLFFALGVAGGIGLGIALWWAK
jgi:hypothetical protein